MHTPFFDPEKSYYDNCEHGPFGAFADGRVVELDGEPSHTLFGHKIFTPIGIPAGPLPTGKFVTAALDKGFTIPIYKTARTHALESHPWPNVLPVAIDGDLTIEKAKKQLVTKKEYSAPLSITNSFGNPSFDPSVWQQDMKESAEHAREGQIVGGSWEGKKWDGYSEKDYFDDWVVGARLLKETGVHFIEANLSCPNEGTTNLLCYDVEKVQKIADLIKQEIGNLPLVLKMSYFTNEVQLAGFVQRVGPIVDGLAAINTISAEIVDENGNQALPGEGRLRSGVCGSGIKWAGLDMTRRLSDLRKKYDLSFAIMGTGGVMNARDYADYTSAGADAVMSATGAMWNPLLAEEILTQQQK